MSPSIGRISSANAGWSNCASGSGIRMKLPPDRCCGDDYSKKPKYDQFRQDICDSVYKASSLALLRSKTSDSCSDKNGDHQYLEACRRTVEFMCALWREQRMCDVTIRAKDDSIQVSRSVT